MASRSLRLVTALLALAPLAASLGACGFQPLYGQQHAASAPVAALRNVQIATIADRPGQMLRNQLEVLFNPDGSAAPELYQLAVTLRTGTADALIRRDETASRLSQTVTADYVLTSLADRRILTRGQARSISSFDVVESDFATINAERDVLEANLRQIATQLQTRLAVFFERRAQDLPQDPVPVDPLPPGASPTDAMPAAPATGPSSDRPGNWR